MLNPKQIYTYFNNEFSLTKSSAGWHSFKCPFCNEMEHRKKMVVNFTYQVVKCWICSHKSYVSEFVEKYEGVSYAEAQDIIKTLKPTVIKLDDYQDKSYLTHSEVKLPLGYQSILEGDGIMGVRARKYLTNRGFDLKHLDSIGVGYCNEKPLTEEEDDFFGYIIIPFKSKGKLVYYIGRDYIGNFQRYKNPNKKYVSVGKSELLFNEDALNIYDEVLIMEGWSDALTGGRNGTSTQGWSLSSTQISKIMRSSCKRLYFVPDAGADPKGVTWYAKALAVAIDFLDEKEVYVVKLANIAAGGKDVNELGRKLFLKEKNKTERLTMESAVTLLLEE